MKRDGVIWIVGVAILIALSLLIFWRSPIGKVVAIFSTPIEFYGKVQDQFGQPVGAAEVEFGAVNNLMAPSTKYSARTNSDGSFSITGIQGAALNVSVWKDGYGRIHNESSQTFGYGMPPDSFRKVPPTKGNPAIFPLRKKANVEPLVQISSRQFEISKDGTPAEVNLETGKPVASGKGHLRVECWVQDQTKDERGHFNWKIRVSVPDGGLIERRPEHDFEAPEDGYRPTEEIVIASDNSRQRWSSEVEREYFVKLSDNRYARLQLTAYIGRRTFFVLESYLNPSGSRNLEFDPSKQATAR